MPREVDVGLDCMPPTYHSTQSSLDEHAAELWGGGWQHPVEQLVASHQELESGSCLPFQIPTSQMMVDGRSGSTLRFVNIIF